MSDFFQYKQFPISVYITYSLILFFYYFLIKYISLQSSRKKKRLSIAALTAGLLIELFEPK